MKILICNMLIVILFLAGCQTVYHVEKRPDGTTIVEVKSFREFGEPTVELIKDVAADTEHVEFRFNAATASTASSPIEQALADGIRAGAVVLNPIDQ